MAGVNGLVSSEGMSAPSSRVVGLSAVNRPRVLLAYGPALVVMLTVVGLTGHLRWSLASTLPWQCDEIPLLVRFTGLCGHATNEAEASKFTPSFYSFRTGALRSLRVPGYRFAVHTSTGFWTNLTLHLFGYSPGAGRGAQLFWSLVAVVGVGWAAWMVVRSVPAACCAAWMVALSPVGVAYGAQARGYAEALALTPLLLIALEYVRRKPDGWLRVSIAFLCALQLSLTIYTMWVYWVLPVMALAVVVLPQLAADRRLRRAARTVLIVLALGLGSFMIIYTADRWKQLSQTASQFGLQFNGPGEIASFLDRLAGQLLPEPAWLALLGLVGLVVLWRSAVRWWVWAVFLGAACPLMFALVHGSPGYARNLVYLLAPAAILFGLGVDALLKAGARRFRPLSVAVATALAAVGASAWAYAGLEQRARQILLPDWGALTVALNHEPETVGPRWFCPCLANHWPINWYRTPRDDETFLKVPFGGHIEVVMGAQHDENNQAVVYRTDPTRGGIRGEPLPAYLAAVEPYEVRWGVEVRRWVGTRQPGEALDSLSPDSPVFVIARMTHAPSTAQWHRFLTEGKAHERGVVTFKAVSVQDGVIQSMIAPATAVTPTRAFLQVDLGIDPADIHLFALTPLVRKKQPVEEASLTVGPASQPVFSG